jgi:geranylgeranyl reductase family protein
MKGHTKYDVIIVGAGPAGAVLGYTLSEHGVETLLIEKEVLPRYKPCGGGLTLRSLRALPFDITEVIEDKTTQVKAFVQNSLAFSKTRTGAILGMVMRDRFDHFLVEKAVKAGVSLRDGTLFRSLSGQAGDLRINTSKGVFRARVIVGADGVNSRLARALGLRVRREVMCAVQGEVFLFDPDLFGSFRSMAHFDFGVIPQGYAWLFPKRDHLSMGVLTVSKEIKHLKSFFTGYLTTKGLDVCGEVRSLKPHLIPYEADKRNILATDRGLVVGDAAGFADPITGEGIYYALRGAQIASEFLLRGLRKGYERVQEYTEALNKEFVPELTSAQRFAHILHRLPNFSSHVLKRYGDRFAEYHMQLITGEGAYGALHRRLFRLSK